MNHHTQALDWVQCIFGSYSIQFAWILRCMGNVLLCTFVKAADDVTDNTSEEENINRALNLLQKSLDIGKKLLRASPNHTNDPTIILRSPSH